MTTNEQLDFNPEITKIAERTAAAGTWVGGTIDGHRFEALAFPAHAENGDYEIGESRISKLWIQRIADRKTVYNWDRGLDVAAVNATAESIVGFLCEGLADFVNA